MRKDPQLLKEILKKRRVVTLLVAMSISLVLVIALFVGGKFKMPIMIGAIALVIIAVINQIRFDKFYELSSAEIQENKIKIRK